MRYDWEFSRVAESGSSIKFLEGTNKTGPWDVKGQCKPGGVSMTLTLGEQVKRSQDGRANPCQIALYFLYCCMRALLFINWGACCLYLKILEEHFD